MPSQQQSSKTPVAERDEWRTPPYLFAWLNKIFEFDVDLAASKENALCAKYYSERLDTSKEDVSWLSKGKVGFCNPPYSNIDPWLWKAEREAFKGFTSVFLIPTPNGEERYGQYVFGCASEVYFITGRIAFLNANGEPIGGNTRGSCVAVYRGYDLGSTRYRHVYRDKLVERFG